MSKPFLIYRIATSEANKYRDLSNKLTPISQEIAREIYALNPWVEDFEKDILKLEFQKCQNLEDFERKAAFVVRKYIPRMELVQGIQADVLALLLEAGVLRKEDHVWREMRKFLDFVKKHQM